MTSGTDLLRIEELAIGISLQVAQIEAVKNASLRILPGKVTALVGESGSGKSVIAQAIMGILPQVAQITRGRILFSDPQTPGTVTDIVKLRRDSPEMRALQARRIAMIFQEPMTALSPLHTIGNQIGEVLHVHEKVTKAEVREQTEDMLAMVGFPHPARAYRMYPFELSGGLRQRAVIAMALFGMLPGRAQVPGAVQAARDIQQAVKALRGSRFSHHKELKGVGIGMASGFVALGIVGTSTRRSFSAIGHTVNLAARLESQAQPGQLLVDENCYSRLGSLKKHFTQVTR